MKLIKDADVTAESIPFGAVEVWFSDKENWNSEGFNEMANKHIEKLKLGTEKAPFPGMHGK